MLPPDREALDRLSGRDENRMLIRGAAVLSMDGSIGDLPKGDILIRGAEIEAVGPDLSAAATDGQALVVDATGKIAIPGLVDTHRHCWQTQLRRLIPDALLSEYLELFHRRLGPAYAPEDMYAGNLLAAVGALDSGVTSVLDFSHNSRSSAHVDEALRAWSESGVRAVFACCLPLGGDYELNWEDELRRLRAGRFANDADRMTLRLGVGLPGHEGLAEDLIYSSRTAELARELELGITVDAVFGADAAGRLIELREEEAILPGVSWIHCTGMSDEAWRVIADTGGNPVLACTSDQQVGCDDGTPPVQKALDHGLLPGLSVDIECCLATDLFSQMKAALGTQRMISAQERSAGHDASPPLSVRTVLEFATIGGARANGIEDRCGSLTPGKAADLVLIDAEAVNNMPLNSAVGTVVLGTDPRNVDTVLIAGAARKWGGDLVGLDIAQIRRTVAESRDRLLRRIDYDPTVV